MSAAVRAPPCWRLGTESRKLRWDSCSCCAPGRGTGWGRIKQNQCMLLFLSQKEQHALVLFDPSPIESASHIPRLAPHLPGCSTPGVMEGMGCGASREQGAGSCLNAHFGNAGHYVPWPLVGHAGGQHCLSAYGQHSTHPAHLNLEGYPTRV